MSFLKYPSIDNHYRSKEIAMWLHYHPTLAKERFIAREKLDGCLKEDTRVETLEFGVLTT